LGAWSPARKAAGPSCGEGACEGMSGPARNLESLESTNLISSSGFASHSRLCDRLRAASLTEAAVLATLDDSPFVLRLSRGRVVIVALLAFDQGFCCMSLPSPPQPPGTVIPPNLAHPTCHPHTFVSSLESRRTFVSSPSRRFPRALLHMDSRDVGVTLRHPHFRAEKASPPNPLANSPGPARYLS
jgi:hypothetical protein